jgi:hypothetical protein
MRSEVGVGTASERRHRYLQTTCGREVTIGRLALGDAHHPAARVFVDLGYCPGCDGSDWAGFTVAEARQLAWALLSQAAVAERLIQHGASQSSGPR